MQTVGIIGAGRMGMPIIGHLRRAGFEVLVSERDPGRNKEVESRGGRCVALGELAGCAQAVLICVGYDSEVRELLNGAGGLLERAAPGTIIAVLSTIQSLGRGRHGHRGDDGARLRDRAAAERAGAADLPHPQAAPLRPFPLRSLR